MTIKQQGGIFGRNPTFNNVDVEGTLTVNGEPISDFGTMAQQDADAVAITGGDGDFDNLTVDGNVLYVDSANNRVGINTSTVDEALHIEGSLSGDIMGLKIQNNNLDANSRAGIKMSTANGTWSFAASRSGGCALVTPGVGTAWTTNNSGNLAFPSGQGIDFSATSGTGTSELFDDYEEGTWTATVGCTGNATTTTTVTAYYTKVGRQVTVGFRLLNNIDTTGLSGFFQIHGLPYACITGSTAGFAGIADWSDLTYPAGVDTVTPTVTNGASGVIFSTRGSGITGGLLGATQPTSGVTDIAHFALTYFTA